MVHESSHAWTEIKLHYYCERSEYASISLSHESRGGNRLCYDSVDMSGLTSSNVIRLESSESRKNGEAKDLGDLVGREWLDDVASILQRMKEGPLYEHGVKMLPLVERLEDLKAGLENDTYIDVILQSLPPSYDPFIVNFNMNGLEKSINELINMLVQYEATIKKYAPSVLIGEASTSKEKGKRAGRWKRKKGKAKAKTVVVAKDAKSAPVAPVGIGKGKKRMGTQQQSRASDISFYCREKGHWKRDYLNLSSDQGVLQRSRKLSKDEVVLRLGDGKAVAAEAVGIINLVIWHARLGHISQDRMKRLVDSKSLETDNLDNLPACESCLKGKMTKNPFVGQSKLANGLLDLIHRDVCGSLNTQARGGFSYFITFTDDISRYGYVYLMRYKSEAFVRFKEFRLEENGIVSQWTPPETPQLNGVAEWRNRTLIDMIQSMMSFTELPLSFWGYALGTAAMLLNTVPSKTVAQTPYQIWHGKPASYKYLRVWGSPAYVKRLVGDKLDSSSSLCRFIGYPKETAGYYFYDPTEQKVVVSRNAVFLERGFPIDTRRDELLLEESSDAPQSNAGTSSVPDVSTDNFPILRRSARVPQPPETYGFLGVTGQLDNDLKTYGEAMSDIDSGKWLEAMKSEMDSMSSNQVMMLVDRPKGVRPVGCKWVYKRKIGADREVTTFKAMLVAKGYAQRPGVNFEETFSPIAMAKSIRIMLAIAAWYDYEIW
ncbi:Retrovirus-related Pol polyprotein from transposon RE2 [Sesamum angolense]|uniref:Retrovirus-related Pol polyprotein from transposon RE2 n=1 Tax=Sesamum angolense TaxID=2727404 RepID=A0AAE1T651_9LAMI|nr:Retrovirus-related Pol polyprotein from transposon RE2 [Sesamum angolense]